MSKKPKWIIDELADNSTLLKTAKIVLNNRIESLLNLIKGYLFNPGIDTLHDLRIGIRRVRFSMEIFFKSLDKKKFMSFYTYLRKLQDLTGSVRDLDVFEENIRSLNENIRTENNTVLLKELDERRKVITGELNLEILKFINDKKIKNFIKMINKERL